MDNNFDHFSTDASIFNSSCFATTSSLSWLHLLWIWWSRDFVRLVHPCKLLLSNRCKGWEDWELECSHQLGNRLWSSLCWIAVTAFFLHAYVRGDCCWSTSFSPNVGLIWQEDDVHWRIDYCCFNICANSYGEGIERIIVSCVFLWNSFCCDTHIWHSSHTINRP